MDKYIEIIRLLRAGPGPATSAASDKQEEKPGFKPITPDSTLNNSQLTHVIGRVEKKGKKPGLNAIRVKNIWYDVDDKSKYRTNQEINEYLKKHDFRKD